VEAFGEAWRRAARDHFAKGLSGAAVRRGGKWGEKYDEAVKLGFAYDTARHAADIAKRFQFVPRRTNLSWGHHAAVASLDEADADRLLDRAELKQDMPKASNGKIAKDAGGRSRHDRGTNLPPEGRPPEAARARVAPTCQEARSIHSDKRSRGGGMRERSARDRTSVMVAMW
jgi:hypothetical protein